MRSGAPTQARRAMATAHCKMCQGHTALEHSSSTGHSGSPGRRCAAIGVCCEALIMALAVFSKNRWLQQELKENIQAQAELMQNQNQVLEATVAERTRELADSMARVEQQHALVVDQRRGDMQVVGLFSSTQIARQMGIPVVDPVRATTFAQIEAAVAAS